LLPVVTEPNEAIIALRWAVREMTRRYELMADMGVRNLANYNNKIEGIFEGTERLPEKLRNAAHRRAVEGRRDAEGCFLDCKGDPIKKLPYLVVIVDELADLMMTAGKEVEHSIARLAQMARAAGIHLIIATQRPSVDVITGLIKANFPSRIAFRVSSGTDSRTILDQNGADKLLGMGDMLWLSTGAQGLKRVHGCFVSEEEVHRIVEHLKKQGSPDYDMNILVTDDEEAEEGGPPGGGSGDELYDRALCIVAETRKASISFLQRKLKVGYNSAARLVERMEDEGVVGPSDGTSRPREIFMSEL
jgi:S-DNA-T family DNA segregation ATPase FtsK/SpoIIIE